MSVSTPCTVVIGFAPSECRKDAGSSLSVFSIDSSTGALTAVAGSPFDAGGPVTIVSFHPTKNFIFALSSDTTLNGSIVIFQMDRTTGVLTRTGAPDAATGLRPTIPGVEPTGKFLVMVNGGSSNIASFSIDQTNGALTEVAGSPLTIAQQSSPYRPDPSWKYLYSVSVAASTVSSYSLDATTGAVTLVGSAATGTGPGYVGLVGRQ
jgi:6-phosphogluconolactonase (cycloisomerase 2 family)